MTDMPFLSAHHALLVAGVAALLTFISEGHAQDASSTTDETEIRIGVAVPLSGPFASLGEQILTGARFAADAYNANRSETEAVLVLESIDDRCDPETATAVANQLIGKNVSFVIGHICDRASIEAAPIYAEHDVIQISPASENPLFTDQRPGAEGGTYRLAPRNTEQAETLATFLANEEQPLGLAVVSDGSVYGKGLATNLTERLLEEEIEPLLVQDFEPGEERYRRLAARIVDSGASHVFIAAAHADAATLIRDLDILRDDLTIVGGDSLVHQALPDLVLGENENRTTLDGIFVSFPRDARTRQSAASTNRAMMEAEIMPVGLTLRGHSAFSIVADTVSAADDNTFAGYVDVLNTQDFQTVLGPIRFDATGDADLQFYEMHEWINGTIVPLPKN